MFRFLEIAVRYLFLAVVINDDDLVVGVRSLFFDAGDALVTGSERSERTPKLTK